MTYQFDKETSVLCIDSQGDVLSTNVKDYRGRAFEALDNPAFHYRRVDLDLSAAETIDSAGLNLLVAIVRRVQRRKAKISAVISSENIRRTLVITRLDRHLETRISPARSAG